MRERRATIAVVISLALLGVALLLAAAMGPQPIPLPDILAMLGNRLGMGYEVTWEPWQEAIIVSVRLPRVVVGAIVGGGLAIAGAAMQGLFRNPLAEPGVIGVSLGASLGASLAIYLGLAAVNAWALPLLAILGALGTALAVYAIASRRGQTQSGTLLLAGVAIGTLNSALLSFLISVALGDYTIGRNIMYWLLGGLDGRTWEHVRLAAPITGVGVAVMLAYARDLDVLLLGESHAVSVGVDVARLRPILILATALVVGAAVAVAGAISFVGLVIPHILRLLIGPAHRALLPASFFAGAAFLVLADLVARTLIPPEEIRLGIITAAVGAPFFLYLLIRGRRELTL